MSYVRRLIIRVMRYFGRYPVCPENNRICDWGCADNVKCIRLFGGSGQ